MDAIHAFSKNVRRLAVEHQTISDFGQIAKMAEIISTLEAMTGVGQSALSGLDMDSNPRTWIAEILASYPTSLDQRLMQWLLSDFTEHMKTRMLQEEKYAIGLVLSGKVVLCHSAYGGETITPTWEIIPRMLDTDNVLRFVTFTAGDKLTSVRFWQKYASASFAAWLGLKGTKGLKYGGAFQSSLR